MQTEFILDNGVLSLLLSPENTLEEELIKSLVKQDNVIQQSRSGITVLNKTLANALVISKRSAMEPEKKTADED